MGTISSLAVPPERTFRTAQDLFDGTTTSIFTITGLVEITSLVIHTTVGALDATTDNVKITANPTTGSSVDICANLDVASDEQGTIYSITGTLSDALVGTTAGAVAGMAKGVVVNTGTLDLTSSGDSNDSNSALQSVSLLWTPITEGATVVVA